MHSLINHKNPTTENGHFIIVLDSPTRENEGDLIIAAQDLTPEKMAFMIRHTSGLICCPLSSTLASHLALPLMVPDSRNTEVDGTAYTVSVDAAAKQPDVIMTTGISAHDRALTCRTLASPFATASSFRRPGHVFPLRARDRGVRERRGHTEATIEFCKLAGKRHVGALAELVDDGEEVGKRAERKKAGMMTRDKCLRFGMEWGIRVVTIEDLVDFIEMRKVEGEADGG